MPRGAWAGDAQSGSTRQCGFCRDAEGATTVLRGCSWRGREEAWWGQHQGVGGIPRVPPPSQVSRNRQEGVQKGAVFQVCGLAGDAWSVGGRASGETACVYTQKGDHVSGAITAACESKQHAQPHLPQHGLLGARSLEPPWAVTGLQGRAQPGCSQQCFLRAGGRLAVPPSLRPGCPVHGRALPW